MPSRPTRRNVLVAAATVSAAAFAGCLDAGGDDSATADDDAEDSDSDSPRTADDDGTSAATSAENTDETATAAGDLDLREANVTAVAVECTDGDCRFEVTLYHDDDGEDGYANWWQVETRDGERLGRRELSHAHGTREFTRSETISIPEGVNEVVVRGHDRTHSYGGQAMIVNLETGKMTTVRQGPEPDSLAG